MHRMHSVCLSALLFLTTAFGVSAQDYPVPSPDRIAPQSLVEELDAPLAASDLASARQMPPAALELIKHFEGWRADAYDDPVGYCTIGFGHLIAKERCANIDLGEFSNDLSLVDGERLLLADTAGARIVVRRLVNVALSDEEFGSLSSFVFNVGKGNFEKSTLLRRVNQNDKDGASKQFGRWIFAKGIAFDGLVVRRSCEQSLYLRSDILTSGRLDRDKCDSLAAAPSSGTPIDILVGE